MNALLLISVALLGAAVETLGQTCVPVDDKIEPMLLKPFRDAMLDTTGYFQFGESKYEILRYGASWDRGLISNLSTVHLAAEKIQSGEVCTTGSIRRMTANFSVGFDELEARLHNLVITLPFYQIPSDWGKFRSTGANAFVSLSAAMDVVSQQCTVFLEHFEFDEWGTVEATFRGNDGRTIAADVFFNTQRDRIMAFLKLIGAGKSINNYARNQLEAAIQNHSDVICSMMN